jgi:DNA invertase Pin-like site-specific DNA recombinase
MASDLIPVLEWIRVSDESQASPERYGIPAQRTANRQTCKVFGLRIVESIEVVDVSGKNVMLTSEFQRLVELMSSGKVRGVVTREESRILRPQRPADWAMLQVFQDTKALLYLPTGPIDFNNADQRLQADIKFSFAGYELSKIIERMKGGAEQSRKDGKRFCSHLPKGVGYTKERGWFYDDSKGEASRVREAYDAVLAGATYPTLRKLLGGMSTPGVARLIRNPIYKGWRVYENEVGERRVGKNGRQPKYQPLKKRDESRVIRVRVIDQPLVSEGIWERAVRVLDMKAESKRRERVGGVAAFNGFLFCDACGRIMSPVRGSTKPGYYVCLNRKLSKSCDQTYVRVEALEQRIDELFTRVVVSDEFKNRLAMHIETKRGQQSAIARLERLEKDHKALEARRVRILDMYEAGDLDRAEKDRRFAKLAGDLAASANELQRARESVMPRMSRDDIEAHFQQFSDWPLWTNEERRRVLSVTVPRIRVRDGQIERFYLLLDDHRQHLAPRKNQSDSDNESSSKSAFLTSNATSQDGRYKKTSAV